MKLFFNFPCLHSFCCERTKDRFSFELCNSRFTLMALLGSHINIIYPPLRHLISLLILLQYLDPFYYPFCFFRTNCLRRLRLEMPAFIK